MANVTKTYECPKCGDIEIFQSHKTTSKKCPTCKSKIERVITAPAVAKDGNPRTFGSMIERNNKRNPLEREKVMGVNADKKLAAESKMRKLAKASPEQIKKYVETGNI